MRVRWTKPAVTDLARICDYTQEHFGAARGRATALAIYKGADSLKTFPYLGRPGRKTGTREIVIPNLPFLIVYRVLDAHVEVVRILHVARKWP
jgi:plasmid stabilization system protein ParE